MNYEKSIILITTHKGFSPDKIEEQNAQKKSYYHLSLISHHAIVNILVNY